MRTAVLCLYSDKFASWVNVQRRGVAHWAGSAVEYVAISEQELKTSEWALNREDFDTAQTLCANRPRAVLELFRRGFERVIFVGADMYFTGPFLDWLKCYHDTSAIVTPHILEPIEKDGFYPTTRQIFRTGHLNSDFVVWTDKSKVRQFLDWQAAELSKNCIGDIPNGFFYDQSLLSHLPYFVPDVQIMREPGYNVAYYNLTERKIGRDSSGRWTANGSLLYCFHFTGFRPDYDPHTLSAYTNRPTLQTKEIYELMQEFVRELESHG